MDYEWNYRTMQLVVAWAYRLVILSLLANQRHLAYTNFSWPKARIPFEDDPRLLVDPDQAVALNNARMDLQVRTCIRLVPRRGELDYVYFSDLGPHIECWNMFEPFPPKGRILVNAGTSCLEPMRRPHRPQRVFSDCDIEYINHLYNCPRRRKSSPICPAGRLIMAKPTELRQRLQQTTTMAGDEDVEMGMEENDRTTPMPTTISTTTLSELEEEEKEVEEDREEERDQQKEAQQTITTEGEGEDDTRNTTREEQEREEPQEAFEHTLPTTLLPKERTTSGTEANTIEELFETTIHESGEDLGTEQPQEHSEMPETTEDRQETMPETVPTMATLLPEMIDETSTITTTIASKITTESTVPELIMTSTEPTLPKHTPSTTGTADLANILTMTTLMTKSDEETAEQVQKHSTTTFSWTTMPSTSHSVIWPFVTDRTISSAIDKFFPTTGQVSLHPDTETEIPLRHPFPLMMTLITTTTTTTIAPPPPDWVRSVEESFRAGDQTMDRALKSSTEKSETTTEGRTESSGGSAEEKQKPSDKSGPPKLKPIQPGSMQSGEENIKPSRPLVVGVIEIPHGSGLTIREKTKVTKVIEKTKYIGPCGSACHYDGQLTRLYRSLNNNPSVMDHFYTTERLEQHLKASQGYVMESSMGFLGRNQIDPNCTCIRPLYRLYSEFANDHFLTASEQEKSIAEGLLGYVHQRILGYCTNEPGCGAYVPLYRFFSAVNRDHFYTADQQEMHYYKTHAELTYAFEKIECYVWQHSSSARGCPAVSLLDEREQRKRDDFWRKR